METSWEVCHKVGGIHTVLTGRAEEMMLRHDGQILFIGPLPTDGSLPEEFEPAEVPFLSEWSAHTALPFRYQIGTWRLPSRPPVLLVSYEVTEEARNAFYYSLWERYGICSDKGFDDYPQAISFSMNVADVMASLYDFFRSERALVAIFNEWTVGAALLRLKECRPKLPTIFITHATTLGRSLASNGKELYRYFDQYDEKIMAAELNVEAKHGVERAAARSASIFATVSNVTARECQRFFGVDSVVLPNGFPLFGEAERARLARQRNVVRERILHTVSALYGVELPPETLISLTSGRYEYHNKGYDLVIDTLYNLQEKALPLPWVPIFAVPAWVAKPRADLQKMLQTSFSVPGTAMQVPCLTHWLHNFDTDTLTQALIRFIDSDATQKSIYPLFIPCYLDGKDGIFDTPYYDFAAACDLTLFPSYYEPWGYTPHESLALGVPTVSSSLAGFGVAMEALLGKTNGSIENGVAVITRSDGNRTEAVEAIADNVQYIASLSQAQRNEIAQRATELASYTDWAHFYGRYQEQIDRLLSAQ